MYTQFNPITCSPQPTITLVLLKYTPEKLLCHGVLQFSALEALYVVVNVGQINMTKIIIMKDFIT